MSARNLSSQFRTVFRFSKVKVIPREFNDNNLKIDVFSHHITGIEEKIITWEKYKRIDNNLRYVN